MWLWFGHFHVSFKFNECLLFINQGHWTWGKLHTTPCPICFFYWGSIYIIVANTECVFVLVLCKAVLLKGWPADQSMQTVTSDDEINTKIKVARRFCSNLSCYCVYICLYLSIKKMRKVLYVYRQYIYIKWIIKNHIHTFVYIHIFTHMISNNSFYCIFLKYLPQLFGNFKIL